MNLVGALAVAIVFALTPACGACAADADTPWTRVGFDQRLGAALPLDAIFRDDDGRPTTLANALGGKPALLLLNVYDCPNLCSTVVDGAFEALARVGLEAGRDYTFVAASIDPRETATQAHARKAALLQRFGRARDARVFHFLTGSRASIDRLAEAAGFRYAWDDRLAQYAHAAGLVIAAPDGRIARYLFGARFTTIGVRLALVEAGQGRIGTVADQVWLLCYHYDPRQGRYGLAIVRALQAMGVTTVVVLAFAVLVHLRRERHKRRALLGTGA